MRFLYNHNKDFSVRSYHPRFRGDATEGRIQYMYTVFQVSEESPPFRFLFPIQLPISKLYAIILNEVIEMTVEELSEMLSKMPQDAIVRIKHELIGDEHYAERIELKQDGCVWIHETSD